MSPTADAEADVEATTTTTTMPPPPDAAELLQRYVNSIYYLYLFHIWYIFQFLLEMATKNWILLLSYFDIIFFQS